MLLFLLIISYVNLFTLLLSANKTIFIEYIYIYIYLGIIIVINLNIFGLYMYIFICMEKPPKHKEKYDKIR